MPTAKTPEDYVRLAERRGITWLGPFPRNTKASTNWKCGKGHSLRANFNNIDQGMGCKKCLWEASGDKQRHSTTDYHALAASRGFLWLGPAITSALLPTVWECRNGHRWSARYNSIQQGSGCRLCSRKMVAASRRRQPAEYRLVAAAAGITWLGPIVPNNKHKTRWQCEVGHQWTACFNQIQQGQGCRKCTGLSPKTAEDYRALADKRGFTWVGPSTLNTRTRTGWVCAEGHRWDATYSSVFGGSGCPECSGNLRKTIADFCRVADERGFLWLGPLVVNSKTQTEWQCPKGHTWFAPFNAVQQGNGCWECSGLMPKTPNDYSTLAAERGFTWVGPFVANTSERTGWQCCNSHLFSSSYNTLKSGHGCPYCLDMVNGALVSKNQRVLCEMIGGELNGARLGRYVIDVTVKIGDIKVAVEYDTWFYHGPENRRDFSKDQALLADGWRILRVRTNNQVPTKTELDDALRRLVDGELWLDIVLDDWGVGPCAPWLFDVE